MESINKNKFEYSEYKRLIQLASQQRMTLHTRSTHPIRAVAYIVSAVIVVVGTFIIFGMPNKESSSTTIYAIRNGEKITNLNTAQQNAEQTLSLLAQTLHEANFQK